MSALQNNIDIQPGPPSLTEREPEGEAFFIGWQPKAPGSYARPVRKAIAAIVILVVTAGIILGTNQRPFSTSRFEYGQLTEVKGIYRQFPVPAVKVMTSQDAFGHSTYITIPLVGYGKFGAEGTIADIENEKNLSMDGKQVRLNGTLIYSDGKTLLQIDKNDDPVKEVSALVVESHRTVKELGDVELTGEILDPKCYFGVMKPGHGKPHRDCAIRCIAGGMSPVFYVRNENGEAAYYLLLGSNGEKINNDIKDFIADPVVLKARAVQYDDWTILYTDSKTIRRTGGLSWFKNDGTISCGPSCQK